MSGFLQRASPKEGGEASPQVIIPSTVSTGTQTAAPPVETTVDDPVMNKPNTDQQNHIKNQQPHEVNHSDKANFASIDHPITPNASHLIDLAEIFQRSAVDKRPFIELKIENVTTSALLDSGANCTVVDRDFAEKLHLPTRSKEPVTFNVKTADGTLHRCSGQYQLDYTFMGRTHRIPTIIMPSLSVSVILGIDFWEKFNVSPQVNILEAEDIIRESPVRYEHKLNDWEKEQLKEAMTEIPFSTTGVIGKTSLVQHAIETGDATPIRRKAYVISPYMEAKVNEEIDRMLKLDVIEPAQSPWNNAMVIVKKPNGKIRYCIDAKGLNAVTKRDAYPLPNLNRILSRLSHTRFLSAIDLSDAFWQIELREEDRPKTAFAVTGRGFYQFKRMPFGLVNSAATLCKLIDVAMGEDLEPHVFRYLDDFIIATDTFQEHMRMLKEVGGRLVKAGLTVSAEKSKFCLMQLRYVGYLIDRHGCKPDPEKTSAVINLPTPKSVKEVRRVFGMLAWYRRFLKDFAMVSAPLTDLMKTKVPKKFEWTAAAQKAFDDLKERLTTAPILAMPQIEGDWILETDASDIGMGGCLKQIQDGMEKVIVYYSQKFSKAQQKYTVTERECLAVVTFIEKSRGYIEGVESFKVVTDHASLKWLQNLKDPQGRLARWALRMQAHSYTITHRPGKQMVIPDALSRSIALIETTDETLANDPDFKQLYQEIRAKPDYHPMYRIVGNIVYRKCQTSEDDFSAKWKIYVPQSLRSVVLHDCHDSLQAAHGGLFKTLGRIRQDYYWPQMKQDVLRYLKACTICKQIKPSNQKQQTPMGKERTPLKKFRVICIDFIGPLPISSKGNQWIFVAVDHFTKFVTMLPMRKATAEKTVEILENNILSKYGVPETIILDNGSQLKSKLFQEFASRHHINLWYSANYHPQANPTEAANHSIIKAMRAYLKGVKNHKHWDHQLQWVACALNASIHTATKVTPFMAVYGEAIALSGIDHRLRSIDEDISSQSQQQRFKQIQTKIQIELESAYDTRARRYNLRSKSITYQVGDIVYKRNFKLSNAADKYTAKLDYQYEPVKILEVVGSNCYRVMDSSGKALAGTYNTADLKR